MSLCFLAGALVGGYVMSSSSNVELKQDVVVMTRDQKAFALSEGTVLRKDKWGEHYYVEVELDGAKVVETERGLDRFTDVVEDALLEANFKIVPAGLVKSQDEDKPWFEQHQEDMEAKLRAAAKEMEDQGAGYSDVFKQHGETAKDPKAEE